jgi:hypothetical protein
MSLNSKEVEEFAAKDERLFNCFEHWVRRFSQYLSPSKMRKFLETEGFNKIRPSYWVL